MSPNDLPPRGPSSPGEFRDQLEDPFEARLRAALHEEADMVEPSGDGLEVIRERTRDEGPRWQRPALVAAAVLAVAAAGGLGVGAVLGGDGDEIPIAVEPTPTTDAVEETPEATPTPEQTPSAGVDPSPSPTSAETSGTATPPADGVAVPVYFLGEDPALGPRLYREFRRVPEADDPGLVALQEMLAGDPADPDYTSPWPEGTEVTSYEVADGVATVDVTDFPSVGAAYETAAVQQLVHTVTAADPDDVERVRLLVDGEAPPSGHSDWSEPVGRADPLETLGLIWVVDPAHGATTTSPVDVRVYGTAWEGNVILQFFRDDELVEQTFVTTAMGEFAEASTQVNLPPGEYRVVASDENAENGTLVPRDDKVFTVEAGE